MKSSVCTLFEGDYHYGVGALVNSLYRHGYRGVIWAGYRGKLPPWAKNVQPHQEYQELTVATGCSVRFVPVSTETHFTNFKPTFMLDLWEHCCRDSERIFYFDPDIVVKCRWSFYEEWAGRGVALCQEITNAYMPSNHPIRLAWMDFATNQGYECSHTLNQYFSGGFIGVQNDHKSILEIWASLLIALPEIGISTTQFVAEADRSHMILSPDQDTLNIAAMITPDPLSTIGPEGMDFIPGGFTMSHAVGSPKPWRKSMTYEALKGKAPSAADKGYLANTQHPIQLYTNSEHSRRRLDLRSGAAVGRVLRRS